MSEGPKPVKRYQVRLYGSGIQHFINAHNAELGQDQTLWFELNKEVVACFSPGSWECYVLCEDKEQ